jgi:hypothetical protein
VRCRACAADQSRLGRQWRAVNATRVYAYNRARREAYAAQRTVMRARARLRYALRVGRHVAEARHDLAKATAPAP